MIAAGQIVEVDATGIVYRGEAVTGQIFGNAFGEPIVEVVATETLRLLPVRTMTGDGCSSPTWRPVAARPLFGVVRNRSVL